MKKRSYTFTLRGHLHTLECPWIMGILNITPDSFYADSRWNEVESAVKRAGEMLQMGANVLDIGGQSTRPGATRLSVQEEFSRAIPAIEAICKAYPEAIVSVDTFYSEVAKGAADVGAAIINDVSAGSLDPLMFETVALLRMPYVLMHMQGEPQTMQAHPHYSNVTSEVILFFSERIKQLQLMGVNDIMLDPGFGFGKTLDHNYQLLRELDQLDFLGLPVLAGMSRKKMIQNALGVDAAGALNGTTAANMIALMNGAKILRVHDVKEAVEVVEMFERTFN